MIDPDEAKRIQQEIEMAPELDFDVNSEPWITIKVKDGSELRFKVIIKGVKKISDHPETGEPRYFVAHDQIVRISKRPKPDFLIK